MIWTLKVQLLSGTYAEEECIRVMEIDSSTTLEDLHLVIQQAVDFNNDHMYEFYVSRTARSRDKRRFNNMEGYDFEEDEDVSEVTLENLFPLEKGKKLFYMFDFGDNWLFQVTKSRKKPTEPVKNTHYPVLVESVGDNPQQYPDFDE